jgi:hypothetical protein
MQMSLLKSILGSSIVTLQFSTISIGILAQQESATSSDEMDKFTKVSVPMESNPPDADDDFSENSTGSKVDNYADERS